jgi:hypothetical protein
MDPRDGKYLFHTIIIGGTSVDPMTGSPVQFFDTVNTMELLNFKS